MNIDDLKKLLAAATPGPWHVGHNELGDPQGPMSIWPDPNMVGAVIARCGPQGLSQGWFEQPAKDAALIVAAVNALPELLAKVKRLEKALKPFADEADRWANCIDKDRQEILIAHPMDVSVDSDGELGGLDDAAFTLGDLRRARAALKEPGQ